MLPIGRNSVKIYMMFQAINQNFVNISRAYIDPGTGSMLFTVLIGLVSAFMYGIRGLIIKLKYSFSGDKSKIVSDNIPFVIYSDDKRYWTTFKPICDEFEKRKIGVSFFTQSKDDPCFNEKYNFVKCEFIGESNKGFAKLNMLSADVLLSTTPGLDVYQWKRSKKVKYYVHIPHMINDITTYRMFGLDYYDAVLVANKYQLNQIKELESIRNIKQKDLEIVGLPYFDGLSIKNKDKTIKNNKTKNILIASSWGQSSVLNKYGKNLISKLLNNTDYHIIVRPHPQSFTAEKHMIDSLMKEFPSSERIEWNKDSDNFNVLQKSDIMISDFSGVIFDFSFIFNRPVIYADTSFDYSPYDAWWLKEELFTFKILSKIGIQLNDKNIDDISQIVEKCLNDENLKNEIANIKDDIWEKQGKSSISIVDYLIKKQGS